VESVAHPAKRGVRSPDAFWPVGASAQEQHIALLSRRRAKERLMTAFGVRTLALGAALFMLFAASAPSEAAEPKVCSADRDCAGGEFCDTTPRCFGNDVKGSCRQIPMVCTREYVPVSGCNGKVYANRCEAAADGQPISGPAKPE
jgi:Cys-rich repeat protein